MEDREPYITGGSKPKYRLCWICNRQFRGNHFTEKFIDGHIRHVHKSCAKEHDIENKACNL